MNPLNQSQCMLIICPFSGFIHCKKPCRNAPNSDVDNGGAEPNNVEVEIFRPPRRLVRATVVHIGISRSFFTVYVVTALSLAIQAHVFP
jgi:hypothetical protein